MADLMLEVNTAAKLATELARESMKLLCTSFGWCAREPPSSINKSSPPHVPPVDWVQFGSAIGADKPFGLSVDSPSIPAEPYGNCWQKIFALKASLNRLAEQRTAIANSPTALLSPALCANSRFP
jgi:hypothetical protein